jgi:hypothetical protein
LSTGLSCGPRQASHLFASDTGLAAAALRAGKTRVTRSAGWSDESGALRPGISGKSLLASGTASANGTNGTRGVRPLKASEANLALRAGGADCARASASANDDGARSTRWAPVTLWAAETGRAGLASGASQRITLCAGWTG